MPRRVKNPGSALWLTLGVVGWMIAVAGVSASDRSLIQSIRAANYPTQTMKVLALQQAATSPAVPQPPAQAAPPPASTAKTDRLKACLDCHDEKPTNLILQSPHALMADPNTPFARAQCETCHGASQEHLSKSANPASIVFTGKHASPLAERNGACLTCHESGLRTHWTGSQHEAKGVACTDCHTMHARDQKVLNRATQAEVCFVCHQTQRAQTRRISSHPLATTSLASAPKMVCSDCHNPHGSTGPKLLVKNTVNETCYTCHAEKRGPFLWEHAPVTDDCTNCHTPHGSSNAPLLKARVPWLCQECHSGDHGAQINSGANLGGGGVTTINGTQLPGAASPRAQMAARACLNCHVLVHGSNHPAGAKFQR
jgi:DmsE family decaheme c-type cytochrome